HRSPVNNRPSGGQKHRRRQQRTEHQEREISRKARASIVPLIQNRSQNQKDGENHRLWMQPQQTIKVDPLFIIVRNGIGSQPVFIQPDIEQQHFQKACEIEDIFFNWHTTAERRGLDTKRRLHIRKVEKELCKEKIERSSQRKEDPDRPPKGFLRDLNSLMRKK